MQAWRKVMAAYRRVYDSRHRQADCQEPGSAPEPYARNRVLAMFYVFILILLYAANKLCPSMWRVYIAHEEGRRSAEPTLETDKSDKMDRLAVPQPSSNFGLSLSSSSLLSVPSRTPSYRRSVTLPRQRADRPTRRSTISAVLARAWSAVVRGHRQCHRFIKCTNMRSYLSKFALTSFLP